MKKNVNAKEELIHMLSEIYNQLEELETALDTNFSGIRKQLHNDSSEQISSCMNEMQLLETKAAYYQTKGSKADGKLQPSIKLELGYKLH